MNKSATLITGAASGIGRELAIQLSMKGDNLVLVDKNLEGLKQTISSTTQKNGQFIELVEMDLIDESSINNYFENQNSNIETLICSAGLGGVNPGTNFCDKTNRMIMEINYFGVTNLVSKVLPSMLKKNKGKIIGISSLAGLRGLPMGSSYSASKAALNNFLESLRLDLHKTNIKVLTVMPGFVKTPMISHEEFDTPFSIEVSSAVSKIIKAIEGNKKTLYFPFPLSFLARLNRLIPTEIYQYMAVRLSPPNSNNRPKIF